MRIAQLRPNVRRYALSILALCFITTIGLYIFCFRRPPPPLHPSVAWRQSPIVTVNPTLKADPPQDPARENFPSLSVAAGSPPPILQQNVAPEDSIRTPLFIGFTRNWPILQQAVVSYLTAGWPAKDIYVVDNTGTMDSNTLGLLTLQNPFYVNYTRLKDSFGVNVIVTPTLLTFAQLQNFFLYTAITNGWENYWWSHMDSVAVSYEDRLPYESLHTKVLKDFAASKKPWDWALKFYAYDRLALVNVAAYKSVGGWDTHIPFYTTDCDFHQRVEMAGWKLPNVDAGMVFDVGDTLQDLADMYPKDKEEGLNSERFKRIVKEFREIDHAKTTADNPDGRNFWQGRQRGGKGEPFYRDPLGFKQGIDMFIELGKRVFAEKWGHNNCDLIKAGRRPEDAWQKPKDFLDHPWKAFGTR